MQNRLRSKTLWVSILSLVLFVMKTYFNVEIAQADKLVDMILIVASGLGVFNNPTDKDHF